MLPGGWLSIEVHVIENLLADNKKTATINYNEIRTRLLVRHLATGVFWPDKLVQGAGLAARCD